MQVVKLLLVGDANCGKTTFLSRLRAGENTNPIPLLRDFDQPFVFSVSLSSQSYRLEFHDTSSPDNWRTLDPDVIILCYDISQRLSLINIKRYWINEIKSSFPRIDSLPLVVLGLKRDLRSLHDPNGTLYPNDGYRTAQEIRADRYVECSSVTGELLRLAFEDICTTAVNTTTDRGGQSEGGCLLF